MLSQLAWGYILIVDANRPKLFLRTADLDIGEYIGAVKPKVPGTRPDGAGTVN